MLLVSKKKESRPDDYHSHAMARTVTFTPFDTVCSSIKILHPFELHFNQWPTPPIHITRQFHCSCAINMMTSESRNDVSDDFRFFWWPSTMRLHLRCRCLLDPGLPRATCASCELWVVSRTFCKTTQAVSGQHQHTTERCLINWQRWEWDAGEKLPTHRRQL